MAFILGSFANHPCPLKTSPSRRSPTPEIPSWLPFLPTENICSARLSSKVSKASGFATSRRTATPKCCRWRTSPMAASRSPPMAATSISAERPLEQTMTLTSFVSRFLVALRSYSFTILTPTRASLPMAPVSPLRARMIRRSESTSFSPPTSTAPMKGRSFAGPPRRRRLPFVGRATASRF